MGFFYVCVFSDTIRDENKTGDESAILSQDCVQHLHLLRVCKFASTWQTFAPDMWYAAPKKRSTKGTRTRSELAQKSIRQIFCDVIGQGINKTNERHSIYITKHNVWKNKSNYFISLSSFWIFKLLNYISVQCIEQEILIFIELFDMEARTIVIYRIDPLI